VSESEQLQVRCHGAPSLPTLIFLPGLHGDWTLVSSFRAAVQDRVRFVEFTYPRTLTWSLEDYAHAVLEALAAQGIRSGWLVGESFSSQVAWQIAELSAGEAGKFTTQGIILSGGFAAHPIPALVRVARYINGLMPPRMIRIVLRI